ncbi:Hypothetical predicted protein, partial [Paramuricea clavata]
MPATRPSTRVQPVETRELPMGPSRVCLNLIPSMYPLMRISGAGDTRTPLPRPRPNLVLPTPVRIDNLQPLLCGYDPGLTSILYTGFKFGFSLHFEETRTSFFANNLISAQQNPEIVSAKLSKELAAGRLAGPFDFPPFPKFRVSPLGVVPKKVLEFFGVPMAPEKTVGPENILSFAGIELDSLRMEARLPLDKTEECKILVSAFLRLVVPATLGYADWFRSVIKRRNAF